MKVWMVNVEEKGLYLYIDREGKYNQREVFTSIRHRLFDDMFASNEIDVSFVKESQSVVGLSGKHIKEIANGADLIKVM